MSSFENNITHDHIYLSNSESEKGCNQAGKANSSEIRRRSIRKKCDIQTEEDREEYIRRRTLNNASCRVSRIHRRSKLDSMIRKCTEYEELNGQLRLQKLVMTEVIDRLKEHLRSLVSTNIQQN